MLILCSLLKISGCILRNVYSAVVPVFWGPTTRKDGSLWQLLLRFQIFIWRASKQGFYPQRDQSLQCSSKDYRELKQPQRQWQWQHQKQLWFYEQNSLACASRILVHFFNVHCTTTMWNHLVWCFMKDAVNIRQWSFLSLQDSTPGEIAYIWQIMQVQIGKVWKDTNSSLAMFSLLSSSLCAAMLALCS